MNDPQNRRLSFDAQLRSSGFPHTDIHRSIAPCIYTKVSPLRRLFDPDLRQAPLIQDPDDHVTFDAR